MKKRPRPSNPEELQHAESYWIKDASSGGNHCSRSGNSSSACSWTNVGGVWRCGGRLGNADLPIATKHPVFLDSQHYLTTLIVHDAHTRIQHNGICETLTEVWDKFWIVRGSSFVRMVIRKLPRSHTLVWTTPDHCTSRVPRARGNPKYGYACIPERVHGICTRISWDFQWYFT